MIRGEGEERYTKAGKAKIASHFQRGERKKGRKKERKKEREKEKERCFHFRLGAACTKHCLNMSVARQAIKLVRTKRNRTILDCL